MENIENMEFSNKDFVEKINTLIKEKKLTNYKVEKELKYSSGSIKRFIDITPSANKIFQLAIYFDTTSDYLLGLSDEKYTIPKDIAYKWNCLSERAQSLVEGHIQSIFDYENKISQALETIMPNE